jgi:hypothetical protein
MYHHRILDKDIVILSSLLRAFGAVIIIGDLLCLQVLLLTLAVVLS